MGKYATIPIKMANFATSNHIIRIMQLKPYHSILVFVAFLASAIATSVGSYQQTQRDIVDDMDRALCLTLQERQDQWITPDTIQDYRSHLRIGLLKEASVLCYVVDDKQGNGSRLPRKASKHPLASKTMTLHKHEIQGYANCSMADVFGMSDQRTPLSLMLMAMFWAAWATLLHKRKKSEQASCLAQVAATGERPVAPVAIEARVSRLGLLAYSASDDGFYNSESQQVVRFTPMQHQLMQMFFSQAQHQLSKQEICEALWPKKPDASETLYTLIRRTKPIAERNGLKIESERGRAYRLVAE